MIPRSRSVPAFAIVTALGGCSTAPSAAPADATVADTTDAASGRSDDASPADAFTPATHGTLPQLPNQGGPRLAHPQIVTVTFAGDPRRASFEAWAQWIATSLWLASVGAEYGVGLGAVAGAVQRPDAAPATWTSGDIEAYLGRGITDGTIPRPSGGLGDALYLVYLPSTTTATATFVDGITGVSCTDWLAFHGEAHASGLDFSYAVMADCGSASDALTPLEHIEQAASHELIEAATDAFPVTRPAWQLAVDHDDAWFSAFRFEVENGDLCEVPSLTWREAGFVAQRVYSNAAARAGSDPCVPADGSAPYFNTSASPATVLRLAPGASATLDLRGWSTAPTDDWQLTTRVVGSVHPVLVFGARTLNNGATTTLRLTLPTGATSGVTTTVWLYSRHAAGDYHAWPIVVTVL